MSESQNLQDGGENNCSGTDLHETVENGEDNQSRYAELITLDNCNKGLGLKICGGCSIDGASLYGIYIKYVIPGGVAANSGQLENGDQILLVNDESLEGVTKDRAISILRRAASQNHAEILIARDDEARGEYIEVLEREHSFISSPVNTIHSPQQEQIMFNGDANYLSRMTELESPWKQLASSPSLFTSDSPVVGLDTPRKTTLTRKTTLDPSDKVHLDKLQGRLYYIGLQPTSDQMQELNQHLVIDPYNQVTFGNFMQAVKIVFQEELNNQTINRSITSSSPNKSTIQPLQNNTLNDAEDLESVSQQRDDLRHQVLKLENLLRDREKKYEKELLKMRKETQATIEENRSLKTRVHLAEQAQAEAQTLEHDYEEVVAFLEIEVRDLRNQLKKGGVGGGDSNKQMTALACQLKNSETRLKMYHAATEKLLIYVEHVKAVLTQPTDNIRNNDSEETRKERREKKKQSVISLINDGQTVIKLVKSLTESARKSLMTFLDQPVI